MKQKNKIMFLYLLLSVIFAIPSTIYLIRNKTIYYFTYVYTYTLTKVNNVFDKYINVIIYIVLFSLVFFLYFLLLKNIKQIFKTKKQLFIFIIVIGILFTIIIPVTSLDVYSYIGNGWVDSHYKENPYYTSVQDITDTYGRDEMLGKVARCWRDEPVVYGPIWQLMCRTITSLSFGNITVALYLFKFAALVVFLGSSILIDKITKKKFFVALFALNPYILFEFLSNVHNDIYLVFFILLAIYFIKNKRNIHLAVVSIAIATGIKYLSILLLPFLICYALREETLKNKIIKTIGYAIEFILVLGVFYAIYVRDFQVFAGIFIQQNKYERSIFLILYYLLNANETILTILKVLLLAIFAIAYSTIVLKLFFNKEGKKITFYNTMKTYQMFLLIFTLILITNFNAWYVIWLFPTLMWQKAKNIRTTLYLSIGVINSYSITYVTQIESRELGVLYFIITIITVAILYLFNNFTKEGAK